MNALDEYFAVIEQKEQVKLNRQMDSGIRLLNRWEQTLKEECPRLFGYTLEVKLPYWKHWVKKYRWIAPSIPNLLKERWEMYNFLKVRGGTQGLGSLF